MRTWHLVIVFFFIFMLSITLLPFRNQMINKPNGLKPNKEKNLQLHNKRVYTNWDVIFCLWNAWRNVRSPQPQPQAPATQMSYKSPPPSPIVWNVFSLIKVRCPPNRICFYGILMLHKLVWYFYVSEFYTQCAYAYIVITVQI